MKHVYYTIQYMSHSDYRDQKDEWDVVIDNEIGDEQQFLEKKIAEKYVKDLLVMHKNKSKDVVYMIVRHETSTSETLINKPKESKFTPIDMKEVKALKDTLLLTFDFDRVSISNRKGKVYIKMEMDVFKGETEYSSGHSFIYQTVIPFIRKIFPNVVTTSGGFGRGINQSLRLNP